MIIFDYNLSLWENPELADPKIYNLRICWGCPLTALGTCDELLCIYNGNFIDQMTNWKSKWKSADRENNCYYYYYFFKFILIIFQSILLIF